MLIALSKTVQRSDAFAYSMTNLFLVVAFAVFIYNLKPYNYSRYNLWQLLFILGNVWLAVLGILEEFSSV